MPSVPNVQPPSVIAAASLEVDYPVCVQPNPALTSALTECESLCDRLRALEQRPELAGHLYRVCLSEWYSPQAMANIMLGWKRVRDDLLGNKMPALSVSRLRGFNRVLLWDTPEAATAAPGKMRCCDVRVGQLYPPSHDECDGLLQHLCDWIADNPCSTTPSTIIKALVVHVYFLWVHPFRDGNGRTARLLEYEVLLRGGVPCAAAHLLSNHYNRTRAAYKRELFGAQSGGDLTSFATYAVTGLAAELAESVSPRPSGMPPMHEVNNG